MLKELYTAAMGMIPQQTRLEVISNNMANANTAGYKREAVFERNLLDARANFYNVAGDPEADDAPIGSYIDFADGAYHKSDNPLDIAIEGKGFFTLQDEAGNVFYTRSGQFKLSTDGNITAMDGKLLMGEQGPVMLDNEYLSDPLIMKDTRALNLKITQRGEIFINDQYVGAVKITDVENPESLQKISNENFIATETTQLTELPLEKVALRQGWFEGSNVDIIREMISMIELQRLFEAGTKVIQTNDGTLNRSLTLGRYY